MSFLPIPIKKLNKERVKNQRNYMKREKIPTALKTKKCSICKMSGSTIRIGNQTLTRCKKHISQYNMRNEEHPVEFERASKI